MANDREKVSLIVYVPIIITIIFSLLTVYNPSVIDEYAETLSVDYRFKLRDLLFPPPIPKDILIVAIDEKSLSEYGRWPWNRKLQAELIEKVFDSNPKAVAVDIFYPESESPESDKSLADVFKKYRERLVVALGFEVEKDEELKGEIEDILYDHVIMEIENHKHLKSMKAYRVFLPPEPIASSATFGHVNSLPDKDGKLRREHHYVKFGEEYFPSLALQTTRIAMGIEKKDVRIIGGLGIDLNGSFIPTDKYGRLYINYLGKEGSFIYVSASDILAENVSHDILRNKIVFIGTTAIATYDLKITPLSANMPGVEKNATVVSNLLNNNPIKRVGNVADLLVVLITGISTLLISRKNSSTYSFFIFASLTSAFIIINLALFTYYNLRINFIYPLLTLLTTGAFVLSYRYFTEEKKAKEIKKIFSNYVTERVVNELIKNPAMAMLGGDKREITVLFSDIRDFTSFSEKNSPEEVVSMLNEYLSEMTDVIFKWDGTLDKFVGDQVIAFWGAPLKQSDHAVLALRCALDMAVKLHKLQQKWKSENKPVLNAGIGINTGEVVVGNIGAEGKKMDYTVIGDHVNLCARVEGLTKKYNAGILITNFTFDKINAEPAPSDIIGHIIVKGLDKVIVKGKEQPVKIYEIKSLPSGEKTVIVESKKEEAVTRRDE